MALYYYFMDVHENFCIPNSCIPNNDTQDLFSKAFLSSTNRKKYVWQLNKYLRNCVVFHNIVHLLVIAGCHNECKLCKSSILLLSRTILYTKSFRYFQAALRQDKLIAQILSHSYYKSTDSPIYVDLHLQCSSLTDLGPYQIELVHPID